MKRGQLRRAALPLAVFLAVFAAHATWHALFPDTAPGQERWTSVPVASGSWLDAYIGGQAYFLGLSYASSLCFAVIAYRRFRERRTSADRNLALGGLTISGALAVAGCFLMGCCGSPMLAVYVSLLGAAFLPWTGPLTLALTLLSIAACWYWIKRKERSLSQGAECCERGSECHPSAQARSRSRALL